MLNPWRNKETTANVVRDLAHGATRYGDAETLRRNSAVNHDIASWGLINATYENMLLSRRAAKLPEDSIIPYGSHSGNTQTNRMGTISGLAIGFVLLVALLGLLSMMGIIPRLGVPTHPIEPPAGGGWTIEEVPCPPNVEPGTIIMESQTPDYPGLQKGG